ncbi:hypothetical protein, partial [Hydrotalea flava]|uniref:hypothetical protein n=1 Tax=Hydrotalea flava TaxID=714549 RepID=UPI000836A29C
ATAPTPVFFKRLRSVALVVTAVATALLTAPVSLPPLVMSAAGYLLTAGTVAGAISQLTVTDAASQHLPESAPKEGTPPIPEDE